MLYKFTINLLISALILSCFVDIIWAKGEQNSNIEQQELEHKKIIPRQDWLDAAIYSNLGVVHQSREELGQALADFNRAIEINPNLLEAYINLEVTH